MEEIDLDSLNLDEVGPPPIEFAMSLADIVRKVNSAGVALDQVVVVGESCDGCQPHLYLDWAKNWPDGIELTEDEKILAPEEVARRREAEAQAKAEAEEKAKREAQEREDMMDDVTQGW